MTEIGDLDAGVAFRFCHTESTSTLSWNPREIGSLGAIQRLWHSLKVRVHRVVFLRDVKLHTKKMESV